MKSKSMKHPRHTPSAIGSAITKSGFIGLALMLAPAANAQMLKIFPSNTLYQGQRGDITTIVCPERNSWVGIYAANSTTNRFPSARAWCSAGSVVLHANYSPGKYEVRLLGNDDDGNWYDDVYAKMPFTVLPATACRNFTSQATYTPGNLATTLPSWLPLALRRQIATSMKSGGAYMQLKGNWCFGYGLNANRVNGYTTRPLQAAVTGNGLNALLFKIKPKKAGQVILENLNPNVTPFLARGSNYRISATTAEVYLYAPVAVSLPIPGTNGKVVDIPAGTEWKVYDLIMDTVLTGTGSAYCAGTQFGPCKIHYLGPITR